MTTVCCTLVLYFILVNMFLGALYHCCKYTDLA